MALYTIPITQDGQVIQIPVVNLGASPVPSKLRAYKDGVGFGEVPLVYPDDNRASKLRVRQDGVTYAIAKDERVSITHTGSWDVRMPGLFLSSDYRLSVYLGRTQFNRATRVEVTVDWLRVSMDCKDTAVFSWHDDTLIGQAWVRLVSQSGNVIEGPAVTSCTAGAWPHPGGLTMWSLNAAINYAFVVGVDCPPGTYDVHLVCRHRSTGDEADHRINDYTVTDDAYSSCGISGRYPTGLHASSWREIARG